MAHITIITLQNVFVLQKYMQIVTKGKCVHGDDGKNNWLSTQMERKCFRENVKVLEERLESLLEILKQRNSISNTARALVIEI